MQLRNALTFGGLLLLTLSGTAQTPQDRLVVHEWGTFLTMNGSNGVTLDGMYHEEHALPAFVHARSKEQLVRHEVDLKGETPVIYFYTNRRQPVTVKVDFPHGIWTQWYPQAEQVLPIQAYTEKEATGESSITWSAWLIPAREEKAPAGVPKTAPDALWNYARDVDAAYVHTSEKEADRFLFYRGLGTAALPLRFRSDAGGTLSLNAADPITLSHLFVVRVEQGRGAYRYIPNLTAGSSLTNVIPDMSNAQPLADFTRSIGDSLADKLAACGLYPKEARAMVNTWTNSYFKTDGIRVLYVLPQEWTDQFIPMDISPRPASLVRVIVGRNELLLPEREQKVEHAVLDLLSSDPTVRARGFATLQDQGRYLEPILRYAVKTSHDAHVREISSRLLRTDYVNQIRAEIFQPAGGAKTVSNPTADRVELTSLLKELERIRN